MDRAGGERRSRRSSAFRRTISEEGSRGAFQDRWKARDARFVRRCARERSIARPAGSVVQDRDRFLATPGLFDLSDVSIANFSAEILRRGFSCEKSTGLPDAVSVARAIAPSPLS